MLNGEQQDILVKTTPTITEILEFQFDSLNKDPHFLRKSQVCALETYWYLRLIENTPHIRSLYSRIFHPRNRDIVQALNISTQAYEDVDYVLDDLFESIKTNDDFVRRYRLEAVRETLTLDYPSYILALAMGAGKTMLIGTIIATEFAMALEYPKENYQNSNFVENALVFAPGKTILESLRELADMPYDKILPQRLYNKFAPNLKLTFTRDGVKDVPVIRGSSFNVVVTNTEKIRIQKESINKSIFKGLFAGQMQGDDEVKAEVANSRLQAIASLPHMAIFSDEAHHTYGQSLSSELKKVRKTVDYLASNTSLVCVVNTTGTPYFEHQLLKDVVFWYGLSEGITDGVLKEVNNGIRSYHFDDSNSHQFVAEVIRDFFRDYANVQLPNGAKAKLAMYFPQNDDLEACRPDIDFTVIAAGQDPSIILRNTSNSTTEEINAFNRLNEPTSPHRIILLVNKGTEGWNCPSLFACALARKLKTSNNFVLQAATRCLRQIPDNNINARIYISHDNRRTLDDQLKETYGETIVNLNQAERDIKNVPLTLQKFNVPPLYLTVPIITVTPKVAIQSAILDFRLSIPNLPEERLLERTDYSIGIDPRGTSVLKPQGVAELLDTPPNTTDIFFAAVDLATCYRLDSLAVYKALANLYPSGEIPNSHLYGKHHSTLARQIEQDYCNYEQKIEHVEITLALVKVDGWKNLDGSYSAEVKCRRDELISELRKIEDNPRSFGYHYAPYVFGSRPEREFFETLLDHLKNHPSNLEDVYFTGGIVDSKKTDFFVEYPDTDSRHRRYVPDFIIRKKPRLGGKSGSGRCLIVEIKSSEHKEAIKAEITAGNIDSARTSEARKALATIHLVDLNSRGKGNSIEYTIIFDDEPLFSDEVKQFLEEVNI